MRRGICSIDGNMARRGRVVGSRASRRSCVLVLLAATLASTPGRAAALAVEAAYVSLDGDWDGGYDEALCATLAETVGLARGFDSQLSCARLNTPEGRHALAEAKASRDYALHVGVRQLPRGELELLLEPWNHASPPLAPRLEWTIRHASPEEELSRLRRRLRASLSYLAADRGVRELVLLRSLSSTSRLVLDAEDRYLDLATGERLDFEQAWQIFREDGNGGPDYLGAALDVGGILALGEVWYLTDTSISKVDWKYDVSWRTLDKKLITGEGLQFDDNPLYLNSPGHPAAGAVYFEAARHHGLGLFGALVASATATAAWEFVTEFREVASIPDLVMTPVGGLAFGEPLYQISEFFRRSEPTVVNRLVSGLFAFPSSLSPIRSWSAPGSLRLTDSRGLAADQWHRFHLITGFDLDHADGRLASGLGVSGRLDANILGQPELGRPGQLGRWITGPLSTRMHLGGTFGASGLQDLEILGETVYAGYWSQDLAGTDLHPRGASGYLGLGALFEHEERFAPGLTDQLGVVTPIGATLQGRFERHQLRLSAGGDLYPVFGAMFSQAWPLMATGALVPGRAPAVLERHGYYWAFGVRASARVAIEYGDAAIGFELRRYSVLSTERLLRRKTQADLALSDRRQQGRLWVAHALPPRGLSLRATFERTKRWSEAGELAATADDSRVHLQLVWEL